LKPAPVSLFELLVATEPVLQQPLRPGIASIAYQ
jgi:hypothetical protein